MLAPNEKACKNQFYESLERTGEGPELLEEILTKHPEVDFIQLQINYEDWENPSVSARANYEVARKHNVSITVMEPIKGRGKSI